MFDRILSMINSSTPIHYEVIDVSDISPSHAVIKKKVPENGIFVDRQFVRIPVKNATIRGHGDSALEQWCYKNYKEPRYLGAWFKVSGYIILDEKTYTHWKLCE